MATKRPDQLPSGSDFEMNDLLMIEKDPDTFDRSLVKTSISDFMGSALKFDPERFGQNPITGFQSQFKWLMESMNALSQQPAFESTVNPYASVQAADPDEAALLPTPTPTYTPSATPLIPPTPTPTVTPSITPTPSTPTFIRQNAITIEGSNDITRIVRNIPNELMPEYIGDYEYGGGILAATGWEFISNQGYYFANDPADPSLYENSPFLAEDEAPYPLYDSIPDNFTKSPFDERLYVFQKGDYGGDDSDQVLIGVVTFDGTQGAYSSFETPMLANSSITFSIRYLY